jgi:hypothetical protein
MNSLLGLETSIYITLRLVAVSFSLSFRQISCFTVHAAVLKWTLCSCVKFPPTGHGQDIWVVKNVFIHGSYYTEEVSGRQEGAWPLALNLLKTERFSHL